MCTPSRDTFSFDQIRFLKPLADPTLVGQVYKVSISNKVYAAKLYKPFDKEAKEVIRTRFRSHELSDGKLEAQFDPWKRETRVYKRIDTKILGLERNFYPTYYGTTKLRQSLCPLEWRCNNHNIADVPVVILELLDGIQTSKALPNFRMSDKTHQKAAELCKKGVDAEYIHIYIHCMERLEPLHKARIIHGDPKPDIFMNDASVIVDFSSSWSWEDNQPCLDSYSWRTGPRSFETREEGERKCIQDLVEREYENNGFELRKRVPSWQTCERCRETMEAWIKELNSAALGGTQMGALWQGR